MADRKTLKGGLNLVQRLLAEEPAAEKLLTAADRAAAGRKAAELIKSQPPTKASEALGQLMERGMKRVTTTQADRTRVGGGNIGGANFPAISEADPVYKGNVWGVMDEGTASRLKNLATPDTAWTTMLGSANQLKTNPVVFDKLKRQFMEAMKQGKLSPELEAKINHNLALNFGEGASIRDPSVWKQADTFEKRAALADLMMGQGIAPKKGGVALGGEKSGKGVIFKPTETLIKETEPTLLHPEHGGGIDTFAAGPRLFRLEKESVNRPDLHPGFPTLLKGEDLGYNMEPVPTEVFLPTWHKEFREKKPERFQGPWAQDIIERRKSKDYRLKGAEGPGYYDLALGLEGEGLPSQALNDEYIRHLLREGFKEGGEATKEPSALEKMQAKIKSTIHEHHMAAGGGAFKTMKFADGGKLVKGARKVLNKLFDDAPQSDALKLAQERAALPTAKGGLGLPKSNTPEQRANAMGIKTDAYHGSKQDITGAFKPGYDDNLAFVTKSPEFANKWIGKGKHTERTGDKAKQEIKSADDMYRDIRSRNVNYDDELERLKGDEFNAEYDRRSAIARAEAESEFGPRGSPSGIHSTVYPLRVEANRTFNPETDMDVMDGFFKKNDIPKNLQDLYAGGNYMMYETKPVVEYLKSKGYDSMRLRESTGDDYPTIAVFNPETTRSRFAAFDPFRKDAATAAAMGVAAPDLLAKEQDKAHGGLTRAFAGGGISTGAGSFSPEDVGMTAAEMNAPAIPAYVKQNASKLMDAGRSQLEKEYSQLKTPQGRADFIKRLGTSLVGSPHDMLHWGLEIGDYVQSKIPGMSKPSSVMLPPDTKDRVPKVSLADLHTTKEGDVYGGASGFNTELKKMKFLGDNEYPLMELPVSLFGPSVAVKAGRGLKSMASKAK
jgi:hypothetical protein